MKKILLLALALALLMPAMAFGAELCKPAKISADLTAQDDEVCVPLSIKVHPALQICVDKDKLTFECLNPYDKNVLEDSFTLHVYSNLPFYKVFTVSDISWMEPQATPLYTWEPNADGVLEYVTDADGVGPDEFGGTASFVVDGKPIVNGAVLGPFGDINTHEDWETVTVRIGDVPWCTTAGWYSGSVCAHVYQN